MIEKIKTGKFDLAVLLLLPIISSWISFAFKANAFMSVILFFGLPSVYLSFRMKKMIKRVALFSFIASVPSIIVIDYISHFTQQWLIPDSILRYRLFNFISIEVLVWAFLNFYLVIMFYEYFLDRHFARKLFYPGIKRLGIIVLLLLSTFSICLVANPNLLNIPYFYLVFGTLLMIVPILIELFSRPALISRFLYAGAYFFFLTSIYEVTALKLDWWRFPSDKFIGWVTFFGVTLPVEEFVFWLILFSMAIITAYERFDNSPGD